LTKRTSKENYITNLLIRNMFTIHHV